VPSSEILEKYRTASRKLLLLDYDGTLVNFAPTPDKALPSKELLLVVENLINDPAVKLMVITGRGHEDIESFVGHLPIDIVAGHGAMFRNNGTWEICHHDTGTWKNEILAIFHKTMLDCPGSFVEEKLFSTAWHYREASNGYALSRKLIQDLKSIIKTNDLKILDGNAIIEVINKNTNKGIALKNSIEPADYDLILCIGDDKTDEDMFEFLLKYENAITIKVGPGETLATHMLGSVEEVILFLKQLGQTQK